MKLIKLVVLPAIIGGIFLGFAIWLIVKFVEAL